MTNITSSTTGWEVAGGKRNIIKKDTPKELVKTNKATLESSVKTTKPETINGNFSFFSNNLNIFKLIYRLKVMVLKGRTQYTI